MNAVAAELNTLLADYQVHYQKLRNYHWNVRGPLFFGLHVKFEELYTTAALRVDALAERVLALGGAPLSTLAGQLARARLVEDEGRPDAQGMVANTLADLEALNASLRAASAHAAGAGDDTTVNLLQPFIDEQEQTAWMLRAFLG
ncbi:MAG: DNA starvation/stationary phase protection protein [Planctomycetota bacterium]|nr:DNA starvation/stationary phase protection protein [Planctomycetota bacterium]